MASRTLYRVLAVLLVLIAAALLVSSAIEVWGHR
jgi:hypothetical protein